MFLEAYPNLLHVLFSILKFLGITSLLGFLSLYSAWLAFPPELMIEGVLDKSKTFNSESKIKIKNSGRLPAFAIKADAENVCAKVGSLQMNNCGFYGGSILVGRLSHGETSEISVRPGISMKQAMHISEFSYTLTLKYYVKLFFFKKEISKKWKVQLRNFRDGYSWDIANI